jgi:hypothetical protein
MTIPDPSDRLHNAGLSADNPPELASSLADICMLPYQWRNIMTIKQIGIDICKLVRR